VPVEAWCHSHGFTPIVGVDYRAMLDRAKPDIAVVSGPFELHAAMCAEAIERGIHVLTEKPAALTFEELERLRETCGKHANVHLAGMMFSRYTSGFYTAWRLIEARAIGDVRLINARKSYKLGQRPAYYRDRATFGGTIPWIGSHGIDWIMWFAGDSRFQSVCAVHSAAENEGLGTMERAATCQFSLSSRRAASLSIDYFRPQTAPTHGDDWARVVGTQGVLEVRADAVTLINAANDGSQPVPVKCALTLLGDFVAHIEGTGKALIDRDSTLALTDACLRARQSADEGRIVAFA
jgi:predicted dehydrogenase